MLTVAQADGPNLIAVGDWTGRTTPLHCVASGKVLLSALAEREVLRIVRRGLDRYTERTIVELEPLLEELARTRRRGYATAIGEYELGLNAVSAAGPRRPRHVIAAVDIWGPAFRLTPRRIPELAAQAREAATAISVRLGGAVARRRRRAPLGPAGRAASATAACPTSTEARGAQSSRLARTASSRSSLIVVVALHRAYASPGSFVDGIVKALLDREATEGTAQELSAVELKKRMDTLDQLGGSVLRFLIVAIAVLMILGRSDSTSPRPSPASASSASPSASARRASSGTTSTACSSSSRTSSPRATSSELAGVAGTVEDFTLRRTTLRDLDGVVHTVPNGEIKVASNLTRDVVAHQRGRDGGLRHRHRQGDARGGRVGRRDGRRPGVEAARPRDAPGRACRGPRRVRRHVQDPGLGGRRRQWAASGDFRKRLLEPSRPTASRSAAAARRPVAGPDDPAGCSGPDQDDLAADTD